MITGGAGFIGSHLAAALAARGATVTVLDDFSTGKPENLAGIGSPVRVVEGSVTDPEAVASACAGCDAVFHLAAVASVQKSVEDPVATGRINAEGTLNVLEAIRDSTAKVVLSSSSAVYGDTDRLPVDELAPPKCLSPYAAQKLASESYLQAFAAMHGTRTVSLRYFNVYGPRQDPSSEYAAVVPKFITRALAGAPLVIFGDGGQTRDFVYVDDIIRANFLALDSAVEDGSVLNIGSGRSISILALAETVIDALGSSSVIEHRTARSGEVRFSECNAGHAAKKIGFQTQIGLNDGICRTADSWRNAVAK